jgi:hypothetical protein
MAGKLRVQYPGPIYHLMKERGRDTWSVVGGRRPALHPSRKIAGGSVQMCPGVTAANFGRRERGQLSQLS